jgi:glycosyltransferase A (GT-A) superfamily protein (DUF2064 family)
MGIRAVADEPAANLLIIVGREPVQGTTKTRLGRVIGMERAAHLYEAFLTDLATRYAPRRVGRDFAVAWAYTPESQHFPAVLRDLAGEESCAGLRFVEQSGNDFTQRQVHLLHWGASQGFARTAIMASDSPQLTPHHARAAFAALDRADVTLGRVYDGGYYLIGVRGNHDPLTGVEMSTSNVADNVAARVRVLGLTLAEIPHTFDVDVVEDLDYLTDALLPDGRLAPATWAALRRLGLRRVA